MNKTILVTRAKGDETEITEALQSLGHFVIHEPLTEIFLNHTIRTPLQSLLLSEPDAVIVTSRHAVQALALLTDIRDMFVLCVGEATADSALSLGFSRVQAAGGTVEYLLEDIAGGYDESARFLYISGEHIRSDLPQIIQSFGMQCERIIAYQAIASEALSDTLIEQIKRGQVDAVTFLSPRNAQIFCDLLDRSNIAEASTVLDAFCLSSEVAEAAQILDWRGIMVADEPTLASLIDTIDNAYQC